jgi:NAD-dependent DNA ligase
MAELEIKEYLKKLAEAYDNGQPLVSDEEYDVLAKAYGHNLGPTGDVPHAYRMYSLNKHYAKDGEYPLNVLKCVKTPKLDGAAVNLQYLDGKFVRALTRGDGIKGRDITENVKQLNVPLEISFNSGFVEIRGEVVASTKVTNSRNFASGALGLKDPAEFSARVTEGEMIFVAYDLKGWHTDTYKDTLDLLRYDDFAVANFGDYSNYPQDGIVYRLNINSEYESAGYTSKFPRGAFAFKTEQEAVITTLLDVVWQVGKSGKVSPIAILEPVQIGDATIAKATLNNIEYIEALDLELGCLVEVIRSGEIIPKIIGRAD